MFRTLRRLAFAASLTAAASTVAQAKDLRVGYIPVLGSGQIVIADRLGWDKEAGIDLRLTAFESGILMAQAMAEDTLDIYVGGFAPLAVARANGADVKIVSALAIDELLLVANPVLAAVVQRAPTPAEGFVNFATGAPSRKVRIGTQPAGSVTQTLLRYYMERVAKVPDSAYEIIPLGIDANRRAFVDGSVDAAILREPVVTMLRGHNAARAIIATGAEILPRQPGSVLAVTGTLLRAEPETVVKLVRLVERATGLLKSSPAQAIPALLSTLAQGAATSDDIAKALKSRSAKFSTDPRAIFQSVAIIQDYQKDIGVIRNVVSQDDLFDLAPYMKATSKP